MKTIVLLKQSLVKFVLLIAVTASGVLTQAQSLPVLSDGLKFESFQHISGTNLEVGAVYRFASVTTNVDALVTIDSLVNGAKVNKIDDNSNGTGYKAAFQPAVQSGNFIGSSYAVFTIQFVQENTTIPVILQSVNATALDLDGNSTLKEFVEIGYGAGATMSYWMGTPDILVSQLITGAYYARNILGIERSGIDTASLANMFTATKSDVSSYTLKYGTITSNRTSATRQFSLYMKGFAYPPSTLPVSLTAFSASLNNNKVDLKWTTASEINVSHFVVEKSTDGSNYSDAGMVFSYGSAFETANYTLSDNISGTQSKVIYYRLRSVDIDGKSQLSATRIIRIDSKESNSIAILTYPNPVNNELRITVPANWQNKKAVYELFNANGQIAKRTETANSSQTEVINVTSLAPGFYIVRVSCEGQVAQQKIVKH
ncbi:MAG TPA: T9SS type A sorting domain-containing protein [Chitinophagaceae bacterium]|nr:T9SS type A sorting domain-containing protein [Chitinophagaceae bacterium]